jgi:hypothetical protein
MINLTMITLGTQTTKTMIGRALIINPTITTIGTTITMVNKMIGNGLTINTATEILPTTNTEVGPTANIAKEILNGMMIATETTGTSIYHRDIKEVNYRIMDNKDSEDLDLDLKLFQSTFFQSTDGVKTITEEEAIERTTKTMTNKMTEEKTIDTIEKTIEEIEEIIRTD